MIKSFFVYIVHIIVYNVILKLPKKKHTLLSMLFTLTLDNQG